MSAITVDPAGVAEGGRSVPTGPIWLLRDTWAEATRHLIAQGCQHIGLITGPLEAAGSG